MGSSAPPFGPISPNTNTNASGSLALTPTDPRESAYDLTVGGALALALPAAGSLPGLVHTFSVMLRAGSASYNVTLPGGVGWPYAMQPVVQIPVGYRTKLIFDTVDGGVTWDGAVYTQNSALAALTQTLLSGTIYSSNTTTFSGTYIGTPPTNLDYSLDGAAFASLATANNLVLSNGAYSFQMSSPASAGSHTLQLRETGTTIVSGSQSFTVTAQQPPSAVVSTNTYGNQSNSLTVAGTANGAPITSFSIARGTASAGPFTNIGTATPATSPQTGVTTASYNDTGLTNGTAYYYQITANSAAGNTTSVTEGPYTPSATPPTPVHCLAGTSTQNAYTSNTSAVNSASNITDGYLDAVFWVQPTSTTVANNIGNKWASSGSATSTNSEYIVQLTSATKLFVEAVTPTGVYPTATSSVAIPTPDPNLGIMLRVMLNLGTVAVTPVNPPTGVTSVAAGTCVFSTCIPSSYTIDSNTFTQLGTTITGLSTAGVAQNTGAYPAVGTLAAGNVFAGRFFKAQVKNSSGTVLWNPDFTAQPTPSSNTATSTFQDTAATVNTWVVAAGGQT